MGLRIIHPRQKYFYCFISMETCWKGFKIITLEITFETQLFFENVCKTLTSMGRTILKYIYSWSVVHTFNIRWISTLDMTLVRSYHIYTPPLPLPQIKQLFRLKGFKRIMCT